MLKVEAEEPLPNQVQYRKWALRADLSTGTSAGGLVCFTQLRMPGNIRCHATLIAASYIKLQVAEKCKKILASRPIKRFLRLWIVS